MLLAWGQQCLGEIHLIGVRLYKKRSENCNQNLQCEDDKTQYGDLVLYKTPQDLLGRAYALDAGIFVQSVIVVISIIFCMTMLAIDIAYAFLDPRIKARYTSGKRKVRK